MLEADRKDLRTDQRDGEVENEQRRPAGDRQQGVADGRIAPGALRGRALPFKDNARHPADDGQEQKHGEGQNGEWRHRNFRAIGASVLGRYSTVPESWAKIPSISV